MPSTRPTGGKKSRNSGTSSRTPQLDAHSILASVGAGRSNIKCEASQTIFRQGDAADAVFYVDSGTVQLAVISEHGKERVIAMLDAGNFFGEGCLAGQPLHMASAVASAESEIIRVEKEAMVGMLHEQPVFSEMFTAFLLSRNIQIEADLIDQLFNSSEAARSASADPCQFRQGWKTGTGYPKDQPGDFSSASGHDAFAHQLFHEQIQETRID
jgi:CRP/FNR family transcriptional regulator, cyclic AMP receptor protein